MFFCLYIYININFDYLSETFNWWLFLYHFVHIIHQAIICYDLTWQVRMVFGIVLEFHLFAFVFAHMPVLHPNLIYQKIVLLVKESI
jgi:hypothetical protein